MKTYPVQKGAVLHEDLQLSEIDDVVKAVPALLSNLKRSYDDLRERALQIEAELSHTNRELEAVLRSLTCGVVVRNAEGVIVRTNEAALSILGVPEQDIIGTTEHAALQGSAADGEPRELVRPDGARHVLASSYAALRHADGRLDGSVEIVDDRTERTTLTEQLHSADKMAALGTMAAGIAHEIRNPLNAVKGFAALLNRQHLDDPAHSRWASLIVEGAAEADSIIQNMLSFGSPERLRLEDIEGESLLSSALRMIPEEERKDVELRTHCTAPPFRGDLIKLRQALRNLIANGIEAQSGAGPIEASIKLREGDIAIEVADAGSGIPDSLRRKVFDPFFTTRAEGTGLGLALVATIARLHGGEVSVDTHPSELGGAKITIRFPHTPVDTSSATLFTPDFD